MPFNYVGRENSVNLFCVLQLLTLFDNDDFLQELKKTSCKVIESLGMIISVFAFKKCSYSDLDSCL